MSRSTRTTLSITDRLARKAARRPRVSPRRTSTRQAVVAAAIAERI